MSNRTQFKQNFLRDFAYFIYANHQPKKFFVRQRVRRSPKVSGGMRKTDYESNACLLLETDLRWLLWRLGLLLRALKSGLWPAMT